MREFPRDRLSFREKLGEGQFGEVMGWTRCQYWLLTGAVVTYESFGVERYTSWDPWD